MAEIVEIFKQVYRGLDKDSVSDIDKLYQANVIFIDPFREIHGLVNLKQYFLEMYQDVMFCEFHFSESFVQGQTAALYWTMNLIHKKLNAGRKVTICGTSHIKFGEKINYHRDYFDAAALLYENIPLLGRLIKLIKVKV